MLLIVSLTEMLVSNDSTSYKAFSLPSSKGGKVESYRGKLLHNDFK